jgi:hypothetical protein
MNELISDARKGGSINTLLGLTFCVPLPLIKYWTYFTPVQMVLAGKTTPLLARALASHRTPRRTCADESEENIFQESEEGGGEGGVVVGLRRQQEHAVHDGERKGLDACSR